MTTHWLPERTDRWPALLASFLAGKHREPFAWGTNDCATFAAEWILLATDVRLSLPTVTSETEAADELAVRGGLIAAVTEILGDPYNHPNEAMRGDIGVTWSQVQGHALCVITGPDVAAPGRDGLVYLRRDRLVAAWRV